MLKNQTDMHVSGVLPLNMMGNSRKEERMGNSRKEKRMGK
jgi:hypothetical protein